MKKSIGALIVLLVVIVSSNGQVMTIFQKGGITHQFLVADIDSIVFSASTVQEPVLPTISIDRIYSINPFGATVGYSLSNDGGASITSRGICWSTTADSTVSLESKTVDGSGMGEYSRSITGLQPSTTYYVRAYATNSVGTAYSTTVSFTTTDSIIRMSDMVYIPAGTFTMGSPSIEVDRKTNETQHQVTLSAFRMSKYEITNKQFADFLNERNIGSNGFAFVEPYGFVDLINQSGEKGGADDFGLHFVNGKWVPVSGCENRPVVNVHWYGASEFAKYVGGTLPTEAQWEYACRAGTTTPFNTGDSLTNQQANYNWIHTFNNGADTITSLGKTQAVGSYPPNAFGLYDMHGNAFEWCNDWYAEYPTAEQTDPKGGVWSEYRVFRGGAWNYPAYYLRSAFRNYAYPYHSSSNIGFRIVFVDQKPPVDTVVQKPTIDSLSVDSITSRTANIRFKLVSTGGEPITECGVYWGTQPNPYAMSSRMSLNFDGETVFGKIDGLIPQRTFYAVAYARNSAGTAYSTAVSFTTSE